MEMNIPFVNDKTVIMENGIIKKTYFDNNLNNDLIFEKDTKIRLIHLINADCDIKITLKENICVDIEEIYLDVMNDCSINVNINCASNSTLNITSFFQNKNKEIKANVLTHLEEGSYINNKSIALINSISQITEDIYLNKDSKVDRLSVYINTNNAVFDTHCNINHYGEDSSSNFITYGICKEKSILNIYTDGIIKKMAKRSNLYQKSKGLLLNKESSISANPILEIDEYDCLASHGASIGAIDEEELYYLMSRGLTKETSEQLIVRGFIDPFISSIEDQKLKDYIINALNSAL